MESWGLGLVAVPGDGGDDGGELLKESSIRPLFLARPTLPKNVCVEGPGVDEGANLGVALNCCVGRGGAIGVLNCCSWVADGFLAVRKRWGVGVYKCPPLVSLVKISCGLSWGATRLTDGGRGILSLRFIRTSPGFEGNLES